MLTSLPSLFFFGTHQHRQGEAVSLSELKASSIDMPAASWLVLHSILYSESLRVYRTEGLLLQQLDPLHVYAEMSFSFQVTHKLIFNEIICLGISCAFLLTS